MPKNDIMPVNAVARMPHLPDPKGKGHNRCGIDVSRGDDGMIFLVIMTPRQFHTNVLDFYVKNGRDFPWRKTRDPYRILVSEIMLQQTQTFRVVPKYEAFIKKFPNIKKLAKASRADVLRLWQGLGYNRRAVMLHRAAQAAVTLPDKKLPNTYEALLELPGIGPYTAGAVMAFAYNQPAVMIETNIRAALIHTFFPKSEKVPDTKLLPILEKVVALSPNNSRELFSALMDFGAFIKQKYPNPSRRSAHHATQPKFEGSDRQIRGQIVRLLAKTSAISEERLLSQVYGTPARQKKILNKLIADGLILSRGKQWTLS